MIDGRRLVAVELFDAARVKRALQPIVDRVGKRLLINDNGRLLFEQSRHILVMAKTIEGQFSGSATDRLGFRRLDRITLQPRPAPL